MIWAAAYTALLAALFVRFQSPDAPRTEPARAALGEPLRLVAAHHLLFYAILLGAPLEAVLRGGAEEGRLAGVFLFLVGVVLYRRAGRDLGDALSPFVEPRPGVALVRHGLYRHLRHPMYLGQACIALGAPLTLGARWTAWLAVPALAVLVVRVAVEEEALARTFPEYPRYAAESKRIVPFLY